MWRRGALRGSHLLGKLLPRNLALLKSLVLPRNLVLQNWPRPTVSLPEERR